MSERERWIVYPLLFLALGAALRDKIIKTTESQRIKCQGLWVLDSNDETLLLLGPEQFPDVRPGAPNLLHVNEVVSDRVSSEVVAGTKVEGVQFLSPRDRVGKLVADEVVARNYILSDGKNSLRLDGRLTVPIMRFLAGLAASRQARLQPPPDGGPDQPTGEAPQNGERSAPTLEQNPEQPPQSDRPAVAEPEDN